MTIRRRLQRLRERAGALAADLRGRLPALDRGDVRALCWLLVAVWGPVLLILWLRWLVFWWRLMF